MDGSERGGHAVAIGAGGASRGVGRRRPRLRGESKGTFWRNNYRRFSVLH